MNHHDAWVQRQREKRDLAELRVLGTAMAHPKLLDEVVAKVEPVLFRRPAHRRLADAIWSLHREGKPVGMESVLDRLIGAGHLDEVGGPDALYEVWRNGEPTTSSCDDLLGLERRRQVWQAFDKGRTEVTNPDLEPDDVAADVVSELRTSSRHLDEGPGWVTTDELHDLPIPDWVVDGVVPAGLTLLFGAPKSGKSYVSMSLAHAYATGRRWFGRGHRRDPGQVLYLVGEGKTDTALRSRALVEAYDAHPGANIAWWDEPLKLSRDRDAAKLRLAVEQTGAGLVVVDTWRRFSGLRDENDAGATSHALGALEDLCRRGVSVVVVHHTNAEGGIRGSTVLEGAVEAAIQVARKHDRDTGRLLNGLKVSSYRTRRGVGFSELHLKWFEVGPDAVVEELRYEPPEAQPKML